MAFQGFGHHRAQDGAYVDGGYSAMDVDAQGLTVTQQQQLAREQEHKQDLASGNVHKTQRYEYRTVADLQANNPSIKGDGLDEDKEKTWRRQYCKLIVDAGQALKIPMWGIAVGTTLCHRFFAVKSMKRNDRFLIATACLFLAAKIEESPKPLKNVITEVEKVRHAKNIQALKALEDPANVERLKEEVLQAERAVLYTLGFDLNIKHPYNTLMSWMQEYKLMALPNEDERKPLAQNAWNLVNDSLRTTLCLQYAPEKIAAAAIWMADTLNTATGAKSFMGEMPDGVRTLCDKYKVRPEELADIAKQMVIEYEQSKGSRLAVLMNQAPKVLQADMASKLGAHQLGKAVGAGTPVVKTEVVKVEEEEGEVKG